MEQKYFELANTIVHNKFLKHSHWVTQATYPVTQETNKRRYVKALSKLLDPQGSLLAMLCFKLAKPANMYCLVLTKLVS